MEEEKKLVEIKPLPEEKKSEEPKPKSRRGRKPNPNKPKPTGEKHVMTDKRKQALLKARLAKAEKKKKRLMESKKALEKPDNVSNQDDQDNVLNRIGQLEETLKGLSVSIGEMINSGVYNNSAQTQQTQPQAPTELRHADITTGEESYVRKENGGSSVVSVQPNPSDRRLTQKDRRFQRRAVDRGMFF